MVVSFDYFIFEFQEGVYFAVEKGEIVVVHVFEGSSQG
jgi:hypothetical protein